MIVIVLYSDKRCFGYWCVLLQDGKFKNTDIFIAWLDHSMVKIIWFWLQLWLNGKTAMSTKYLFCFWPNSTTPPPSGPRSPQSRGFYITHNDAPQSVGLLLWTSDQLVAETSTCQHTTLTTDRHPCPQRDSNPLSRRAVAVDLAATGIGM